MTTLTATLATTQAQHHGTRTRLTDAERGRSARAIGIAASRARSALVAAHRAEYDALYAAAVTQARAEAGLS